MDEITDLDTTQEIKIAMPTGAGIGLSCKAGDTIKLMLGET